MRFRVINVVCGVARLDDTTTSNSIIVNNNGFKYEGEGGIRCDVTKKPCEQFNSNYLSRSDVLSCPHLK